MLVVTGTEGGLGMTSGAMRLNAVRTEGMSSRAENRSGVMIVAWESRARQGININILMHSQEQPVSTVSHRALPPTALKTGKITNLILFFILSLLVLVIVYKRYQAFKSLQSVEKYSYVGNDFPELLPLNRPLEHIDYAFSNSTGEYSIHGPHALDAWNRIYPSGFGFVRLGSERRILCVSMFHQLHCIEKMRRALDDPDDPIATIPHLQHCMNYIRQMVLCGADLTLEPEGSNGVGVTHTCTDWGVVYETVNDNYERWTDYWQTVKGDSVLNA